MSVKELPVDIDAEQAVCGALIIAPARLDAIPHLSPDDFYDKRNRFVFSLIPEFMQNAEGGYITLKNLAEKRGVENVAEYTKYIMDLMDLVPATDEGSVKFYADIVKDKSERRTRIAQLEKALNDVYDTSVELNKTEDFICDAIFRGDKAAGNLVNFGEAFKDFSQRLKMQKELGDAIPGIPSGFSKVDTLTGGFEPGRLYVIGGRPAMGKTALALNIITKVVSAGKTAAFFSLEMGNYEVVKRIMSGLCGINSYILKRANVSDDQTAEMDEHAERIKDNLIINDNSAQTAAGIMSECIRFNTRNRKNNKKIDVVVIDYLQLLSNDNKRLDRRIAIGESSRQCKIMAKQLNCPVILLSQLSRANESRIDKMPMLSDLRESGDIEQDADVVMLIHRPEYYERDKSKADPGLAQLNIAKNRDGEIGIVELRWDKSTTRFDNIGGDLEL